MRIWSISSHISRDYICGIYRVVVDFSTLLILTYLFSSLQRAGDIAMEAGQLQHALELYQASKVNSNYLTYECLDLE